MTSRKIPNVFIADTIKPAPEQHEIEVAWILARWHGCTVEFLRPTRGYKVKTADIVMNGVMWEIKSPTGTSSKTIENQLKKGAHQSRYIVIDGRRTKLADDDIQKKIVAFIHEHTRMKKVILVSKQEEVLEVLRRHG